MKANLMRSAQATVCIGMLLLIAACGTRSISNSGYVPPNRAAAANPFYHGELTEFDVLGIDFARAPSDDEIARSAAAYQRLSARKGAWILLMQSGSLIPDAAMVEALGRDFSVVPFSGVPMAGHEAAAQRPAASGDAQTYARALRLAAAKGGAELILCYWGWLESTIDREPTKAVSWIPTVGSVIPDEAQHMRIRLKLAVIDVKSGSWTMLAPPAFTDSSLSTSLGRESSDQAQVESLKQQAYQRAAETFAAKYID
jgi:hypothetical protein